MTDLIPHPTLGHLAPLVGAWAIEATHQALPGDVIRGRATFEWLGEGEFLVWRARYDHPDIPDSIAIMGCDDVGDLRDPEGGCTVQYYDVRGVTRRYRLSAEPGIWRYWREVPGFSQRFTGTISEDGGSIDGVVELNRDDSTWEPDLSITYRRIG
ncbi:MAG TPA: hypothetical protein VD789_01795 [Thermomicrobiales bacterium]|nr:hypothetical protein [Thermomicrobiales bacterium]